MALQKTFLCKLCNTREASAIKSHIFTHVFLRSLINPPGQTKRGVGRSFGITPKGVTAHVERDIKQEEFEDLFGKELTDEQYEKLQMDQFAQEHFLCTVCENRIKVVEDYFNDNVYRNISTTTPIATINGIEASMPGQNNRLIRLFFYTLMWRASVARYTGFYFPENIEVELRNLLDLVLGNNLAETNQNSNDHSARIEDYPLIIATVKSFSNPGSNQVYIAHTRNPFYFSINEYIVWFYPDHTKLTVTGDFLGLELYVQRAFINRNEGLGRLNFILIPESDWLIPINKNHERMVNAFFDSVNKKYVKQFRQNKRKEPSFQEYKMFREAILGDQQFMGIQWTPDRIDEIIRRHTTQ
jgi:hypothetical protein